jgi:hypothetical protein
MVEVIYQEGSRLGNRMFQYAIARKIAEELGYELVNESLDIFPVTAQKINGKDYSSNGTIEIIGQEYDFDKLINEKPKKKILINGYFQRFEYYESILNDMKKWFMVPNIKNYQITENDCLIFIRRTDYILLDSMLPESFYEKCITEANPNKIYITTDDFNDPWIKKFIDNYNAIPLDLNTIDTFSVSKLFNKIIISQSTFAWWCALLSDADEIYFPVPKKGFWSDRSKSHFPSLAECMNWTDELNGIDLRINQPRIKYIKSEEYIMSAEDRQYYKTIMPVPYLEIDGDYDSREKELFAKFTGIAYAYHNNFAYKHTGNIPIKSDEENIRDTVTITKSEFINEVIENPDLYFTPEVIDKLKEFNISNCDVLEIINDFS